ncbi:Virus X resistance protein-like, coiled-coil domain [Sesbania bispinosa]|nr:Virus X resistance protein-like, coiled-coil domain [Sesbania bispinosa]
MAEMAVSFALDHLLPLLSEEATLLKGIHMEFKEIKDELESIQAFLKDADRIEKLTMAVKELKHGGSQNAKWHDPRMASLYIEDADVVGFEGPKTKLIDWLVNGRAERTVISVVGMGGLAKKVFDNKDVVEHFDCHAWITVSQSYTVQGLLRVMLHKFYKQKRENLPQGISEMDRGSLINEVTNFLQQKRNVIVFDDVWNLHFWDEIEFAVIDSKNGSRIFITTRKRDVVEFCKKSSFVEVHELQPLTQEQSLKLFYRKAFLLDHDGCCPQELIDMSFEIVKKCNGLPLAIVAIGGLLSCKEKNAFEWKSYDELPYYLKSCLLYFGMYPEDYEVSTERLIQQWIAEGFVKQEREKTLEEVAKGYLTELIHRSLVQVSSISIDGKAKACHVHDLLHDMILKKFEDLSFCQFISEHDQSSALTGIIRRLSIAINSNDLMGSIEISHVRSLLFFTKEALPEYLVRRIPTKYLLLKVLDFEGSPLSDVPENLGNLIHLKYLSFRGTHVKSLPKSIGGGGIELIKELGKVRELRKLSLNLTNVEEELVSALCSSINEMYWQIIEKIRKK